jgi:hypothetical protein
MGTPSGEIVGRPLVARACGCLREFQEYAVDKYRAQRLAKFRQTRCEVCVAKLNEQQRNSVAGMSKAELFGSLPAGAQLSMTRLPDGTWAGSLAAEGASVEATAGLPQELAVVLARQWLSARGGGAAPGPGRPAG